MEEAREFLSSFDVIIPTSICKDFYGNLLFNND
jgi:hypothetical protein